MKKLKLFFLTIISILLLPTLVNASSGSIKVTGSSTAVVNNRVTVTVTLSSGTAIGSWQMELNYDKSYLQLVSSTAENGGTGMVGYTASANGTKSKSYSFTFKTLKKGTTRVSVSSYIVYDNSFNEMSITASSNNIKIITQEELEASYSKDNNLKSLSVEGYNLDKEFNKDTLEYTVDVPTGTTSVKVDAKVNDSTASVSGLGEITVTEGLNSIPIIVTAQNGDEKTYTLIVNVEDQNPINVQIDNKDYIVVKNNTLLEAPLTFDETTITIEGFEIPAFHNSSADITLVGLKDSTGNILLVEYKDNKYYKYNELNLNTYMLVPTEFSEELNLIKTTVTLNGEKISAYKYSENSDYVIISCKSLNDGKIDWYLYDTVNKTASRYDAEFIKTTNDTVNYYTYIIIAFAAALVVMLIVILSLTHSLHKKQKKIQKFLAKQEAKMEATRKLNDVVDEVQKITNKEKHEVKQDTTALPKQPKENAKKEAKDETEIQVFQIKPLEEDLKKTKKIDKLNKTMIKELPKDEKKEQSEKTPASEPQKNLEETEVYRIFDDDFKTKKKKKK